MKESSVIQSMTGFGSSQSDFFSIEIRSVNHRFFDAHFRMPYFLNKYEVELRKRLRDLFSRGRFEVSISVNPMKGNDIVMNSDLAGNMVESLNQLKKKFSLKGEITIDLLAGFRDVFITDTVRFDEMKLMETFGKAATKLFQMRLAEGVNIKQELEAILGTVNHYLECILEESEGVMNKLKQRMLAKFHEHLSNQSFEEHRVIQEAFILAERSDITEELARLQSHVKQFRETLDKGGTVGKKLDFLLQEFFREANTIASKASEYEIISTIIDMKNEIEKLREQVQNVQ